MDSSSGNELLAAVAARARDLGIAIDVETLEPEPGEGHADALLRIECGGDARTHAAAIKRGLRPATLGVTLHHIDRLAQPAVLITDYVTPQMAEALKERGTDFLDAAGNAYINQPPVLVWVKGERPAHLEIQPADIGRAPAG